MHSIITRVVSFHRTALITPLIVQLRLSIALHKLNCVQSLSWYFMCLSYHIPIYVQSSCSYSKHNWYSECCSFSLVMVMQQQIKVMCVYILHFYHRCCKAENISGTGRLLLKDSKLLYNIGQRKLKIPVYIKHKSKQSNVNALINLDVWNTSKLSNILCESRLSEFSAPYPVAFLYLRISKTRKLSKTKTLVRQTKTKFE